MTNDKMTREKHLLSFCHLVIFIFASVGLEAISNTSRSKQKGFLSTIHSWIQCYLQILDQLLLTTYSYKHRGNSRLLQDPLQSF